jgi:hypothetical protein
MNDRRMYVKRVYKIGDYYDAPKPRTAFTAAERRAKYIIRKRMADDLRKV